MDALKTSLASLPLRPRRTIGALVGFAVAFALSQGLSLVASTVLSSVALAGGASLSGRTVVPWRWWAILGFAAGSLLGTAGHMAARLSSQAPGPNLVQRGLMIALLAGTGVIVGSILTRDAERRDRRPPRDLLRSASALTTGIFAALVTLTFIHSGLETARAFSSRLSTSLTILVAALSVPGWISHQLSRAKTETPGPSNPGGDHG